MGLFTFVGLPDIALETKMRGRPLHTPPGGYVYYCLLQGSEPALDKLNRFQKPGGFCRKVALALIRVRNTGKLLQDASVGENGLSYQLSGVSRFTAAGLRLREPQVGKREFEIRFKRQGHDFDGPPASVCGVWHASAP